LPKSAINIQWYSDKKGNCRAKLRVLVKTMFKSGPLIHIHLSDEEYAQDMDERIAEATNSKRAH
jgi:hypothetical protein